MKVRLGLMVLVAWFEHVGIVEKVAPESHGIRSKSRSIWSKESGQFQGSRDARFTKKC
jgi:hypothetical protein